MTGITSIGGLTAVSDVSSVERRDARQGVPAEATASALKSAPESPLGDSKQRDLQEAIRDANVRLAASGRMLELSFDSRSGVLTMQVVSKKTGEVLLQIPAEKYVADRGALISGMGLLVDQRP